MRWPAILFIAIFDLIIVFSGIGIYRSQKLRLEERVMKDLDAIARLKVSNMIQWRQERIYNARIFFNNPNFENQLASFIKSGAFANDPGMDSWVNIILHDNNIDQVLIFDSTDKCVLSKPLLANLLPPEIRSEISAVKYGDSMKFIDFYRQLDKAYLGLIIPIYSHKVGDGITAKVFFRINPDVFLFPYIETWPTVSKTAETLIGRREGDSAQFLNKLHFGHSPAMQFKYPMSDTSLAVVKGLIGTYGVVRAVDYRKEKILAAIHRVPGTPWVMVAKEDQAEIFAELRSRLMITLILIITAVLLLTFLMFWIFIRREKTQFRKLYEQQKERDWLYDIMEHNLNEIYVFDSLTLKFRFVNYGARLNLGYTMEELKALTPVDIKPLVNSQQFEAIIGPLKRNELHVQNFKTVHRRKNGTDYPVEVFLELMESDQGKVFLAMVNDITARVHSENALKQKHEELVAKHLELEKVYEELQVTVEELQQTGEELETTNEELNVNLQQISILNKDIIAAKEIAENANRLKSSFLANMSHEIRTPLNGIMGFSDLLVEMAENEELQRMAQIIMNSSNRLLNTVNSILDISVLESGSLTLHPKKIQVSDLIKESIRLYTVFAEKKGVPMISVIHSDYPVIADEELTLKIINNLLNNALKFTYEGQVKIELTTDMYKNKRWVVVKVTDTGIGISKENMGFLFEEFRQFNEGLSKQYTGSGLGLNISKRYAEVMDGRLTAESSLGEGSTFTLWLPELN